MKRLRTHKKMKNDKVVAEEDNYSGDKDSKRLRIEKLRMWRVLSKAF